MTFHWYHAKGDGTADRFDDTPLARARVDSESNWYGSPEGAIIHGAVIASAFTRKVESTYDAMAWLETGAMVPAGELVTIEITASPQKPLDGAGA